MLMQLVQRIRNKLFVELNPKIRENIIIPYNKHRLKANSKEVTLLCNNCIGGVIFHELGLKFMSPTINLWIKPTDFIKFCANLQHYIHSKLVFQDASLFLPNFTNTYPIALLDDIVIYFLHYSTEEEARQKWEERSKRINYDNIKCILVERDGCTEKDLLEFSHLPYPTASLVHKPMYGIPDTYYVRGFEQKSELGDIMVFKKNMYWGHKYFDDFDFVSFLNKSNKEYDIY